MVQTNRLSLFSLSGLWWMWQTTSIKPCGHFVVEKFNLRSESQDCWGWTSNYGKHCSHGKHFLMVLNHETNSSNCRAPVTTAAEGFWTKRPLILWFFFEFVNNFHTCLKVLFFFFFFFGWLALPLWSSTLWGFHDTALKNFCALSGSVCNHGVEKFSQKSKEIIIIFLIDSATLVIWKKRLDFTVLMALQGLRYRD